MERVSKRSKGEVNEIRATPAWEIIQVQIDSGAIDTVVPREIAKAVDMRETVMSKIGIGYGAANGNNIKNYGEKKIVGYIDDGEGVSWRMQCADVKNVLRSLHKLNMGGKVVVLDG